MNQEEALIYLPFTEEEELQDVYEEKLFELKQFFLNRFPVKKLIDSRLSKFSRVEEAFVSLGGVVSDSKKQDYGPFDSFSSLHQLFTWYNVEKNKLRLQLVASTSHQEISHVLENYLTLTHFYAKHWQIPVSDSDSKTIKIGVEPNSMDLQQALSELNDVEILNSEYILSLPDDNCLKSEAKRLSLWLNFETNEQSIR